ncbi:hypothetical protein EON81_20630 [bacterium]|nr:MAG: hypothetical protein EON81_20630 [bacterium]
MSNGPTSPGSLPPETPESADRFAEFRRVVKALIQTFLVFAAGFGLLMLAGDYYSLHSRLAELRGFRAGIPATMLPAERRYRESPIVYKGERMTLRHYPSTAWFTATDYNVIVNREGIVEAAFSTDSDSETEIEWLRKRTK